MTPELRAARIFAIARVYPSFSTGSGGSRSKPVLVRTRPGFKNRVQHPETRVQEQGSSPLLVRHPLPGRSHTHFAKCKQEPISGISISTIPGLGSHTKILAPVWDSKRLSLVNWQLVVFTRYSLIATVSRAATGHVQYQKRFYSSCIPPRVRHCAVRLCCSRRESLGD